MIYRWYNEDRWFDERFTGNEDPGRRLLAEYCPSPGKAYFRHSYASFRVNGLEYARLQREGRIRYGIRNAPLEVESISPRRLVDGLVEMFEILADAEGAAGAVDQWVSSEFVGPVAHFFRHVARHHQAEHWLECQILATPRVLFGWIDELRSQVAVCEQGGESRSRQFIDLLGADYESKVLWVIELKAARADRRAISQARTYAASVNDHICELLGKNMGYFQVTGDLRDWTVAICFAAPGFTSTFRDAMAAELPGWRVETVAVNSDWRRAIAAGAKPDGNGPKGTGRWRGRWAEDQLTARIINVAERAGLCPQEPAKSEYINLRVGSKSGNAAGQIHRRATLARGRALVVRCAPPGFDAASPMEPILNYEELTGDVGANKPWLRATGKSFGRFEPAKVFWIPELIADHGSDHPAWRAVRELLKYAYDNSGAHAEHRTAVVITHGDVDGMVCAAQLIRREKSDCEIQFSNARWVGSKLRSILRREELPKRVYVTDIPADGGAVETVEQLARKGVSVFWIDHHPWPAGALERMLVACEHVVYNEAMSTPAGILLGRWLADEDPYCDRVGLICYAYEKGTPWERNWFRLLASYVGRSGKAVLERLAYDQEFTEDDRARIQGQIHKEQLAEKLLSEEPRVATTRSGKAIAVYDLSDTPGVHLGAKVFRHHEVDYSLIRISPRKWQIACNPTFSLTLQALVGEHDLDGMRVRVAGRKDRLLSIEIDGAEVPPDAHERIIAWAQGLL